MRAYNFAPTILPTATANGPDVNLNSSLVKPPLYVVDVQDQTVVVTSSSGALFTAANTGIPNGSLVTLGGTVAPTGFTLGQTYYAVSANVGAKTFKLAATRGGGAIAYTDAGTAVTARATVNYGTGAGGQDNDDVDGTQGFQFTPGNSVVVEINSAADHAGTTIALQGADPSPSDPTSAGSYTTLASVVGISAAPQLFQVVLKQFLRWSVVADASEGSANAAITLLC